MRNVFSSLIVLVLVLGIAGNALADVDWNNAAGDRRWDNPGNWSTGAVPTAADKTGIRNSGDGPIIDSVTTAQTKEMPIGDWSSSGALDITGGSLSVNGWCILGYGGADEGTLNVSGGTATIVGNNHLTVARAGTGNLNMSGGAIEVGDRLHVASNETGTGNITMTGGLITINDDLYAGEPGKAHINMSDGVISIEDRIRLGDGAGGEADLTMTGGSITLGGRMQIGWDNSLGELFLDGGTIEIGAYLQMGNNGSIDITGGTLIIDGDRIGATATNSIIPFINDGRITAYGGEGTLNVDYDTTNPGKTTLTARFDPNLPSVDAGEDKITWSGQAVTMDPNVANNDTAEPQGDLIYLWTAEPDGIGDPNLDVAITDADQEVASVTITKAAPTGDATVVMMTLTVTLPGEDPVKDAMTIDVYDDACLATKAAGQEVIDPTDTDANCITDFADFAVMATTWLDDYTLTGPIVKLKI